MRLKFYTFDSDLVQLKASAASLHSALRQIYQDTVFTEDDLDDLETLAERIASQVADMRRKTQEADVVDYDPTPEKILAFQREEQDAWDAIRPVYTGPDEDFAYDSWRDQQIMREVDAASKEHE